MTTMVYLGVGLAGLLFGFALGVVWAVWRLSKMVSKASPDTETWNPLSDERQQAAERGAADEGFHPTGSARSARG